MSVPPPLESLRGQRFFSAWDEFVGADRVEAAEASVRALIDELLAHKGRKTEKATRAAVRRCVDRFNEMDEGWICTIEREDISEAIGQVVDSCGFECDEDWIEGREW